LTDTAQAAESSPKHKNRLAEETSPYLLQHQHNPVDWFPWSPEAFDMARRLDKPIFLSVGYSTCYWCHVMERQCFENPTIAAEMNQRFINIKVDREERPDVDQLYMAAVQVLTHHGGWPMSVFLTTDLRPFYGGTYMPPTDSHGRPGFLTVLRGIEDAYRNRRDDVNKSAQQLVRILREIAEPPLPAKPIDIDDKWVEALVERSVADYESVHGGFGSAPKFPRETLLELILVHNRHFPNERRMKMLRHTLDSMANGGIRDHLGGGFHRYSTDAVWLVPHFEIMLYDNAMLLWVYAEAFAQTREPHYEQVARGIAEFVLREMTSPDGAFYTAFDAEVDAREGLSYLWTREQVVDVLGVDDAPLFNRVYGLEMGPNFADPHHGSGVPDTNILFLPRTMADAATAAGMDEAALQAKLEPMRQKLYWARRARKQPLLDTKILTSWNALMVRGLAHAGRVFNERRYVEAASKAVEFLLTRHRTPDGGLYRTSRDGAAKYNGFLDDYASLCQALLALADAGAPATSAGDCRDAAETLLLKMTEKFGDDRGTEAAGPGATPTGVAPVGFFFTDRDANDLIVRQKTAVDSPLPSGNGIAAMVLLELGRIDAVRNTLGLFAQHMEHSAEGMSAMVEATTLYLRKEPPFRVAGTAHAGTADRPLSPQETAAGVVTIQAGWTADRRQLHLKLSILKGFHVNTNNPGGDPKLSLYATTVVFPGEGGPDDLTYPPGEELKLAFSDTPIRVYTNEVTLVARFRTPPEKGSRLKVQLSYQACDDRACLPPVVKQMEIPV
jgi:uncharacterized protein YyaL (SSP411 family)